MSLSPLADVSGRSPPENYERYFVPAIGAPVAEDLVERAALRSGERVLDVACGTGVVARLAAGRVGPDGAVAGLDVNPGMLAVARSATPPDVAIDWHEASAERMPLPDASFDAVLCQMGIQFMPDKQAAAAEMRRVLAPGGRLALNVPGPTPEPFVVMADALAHHIATEAAGFVHQVFSLHETSEVEALLQGAGFQRVVVDAEETPLRLPPPGEFLWQYIFSTPLAGVMGGVDDEDRTALERDVVACWEEFVQDGALVAPVRMVSATAWAG